MGTYKTNYAHNRAGTQSLCDSSNYTEHQKIYQVLNCLNSDFRFQQKIASYTPSWAYPFPPKWGIMVKILRFYDKNGENCQILC